jgi:hypothetical protein
MWEKRHYIYDHSKQQRGALFYDSFHEFVENVLSGKKWSEKEIRDTRYYRYLRTHASIKHWNIHQDVLNKINDSIRLIEDIRDNGLIRPIEAFRYDDGQMKIERGYRRFVILKALGYKKIPLRVCRSQELSKKFPSLSQKPIVPGSIDEIGMKQFMKHGIYSTDKYYTHDYLSMYDKIFGHLRDKHIKIIELGLLRGASLAVWHKAFPKAEIFCLDRNKNSWKYFTKGLDRIKVFVGHQEDNAFMESVAKQGPYNIIIDDCGHSPDLQWNSFKILWPSLLEQGYYCIEDCNTSFKPEYTGFNIVNEFASWVSSIYLNQEIYSLNFYYNMCCVQKGISDEH